MGGGDNKTEGESEEKPEERISKRRGQAWRGCAQPEPVSRASWVTAVVLRLHCDRCVSPGGPQGTGPAPSGPHALGKQLTSP